jgi:putative peptidoglycan lipid II flippase
MALLILPATMALAVNQINIIVSNILASYLQEGSITYLYYSMRLIQFPVGIFGVAMGMAVLPAMSEHAARGDFDRLQDDFSFALRLLFFIAVPSMAGLIALREPIVNLLFQRGQFDYAATRGTAEALFFYSIGIWSIVGVRVVTATFYSMQDTRTPVKIATIGVASNLLLSLILMGPLKYSGLALANSLASGVNFLILFYFLKKKFHYIDSRKIAKSFSQIGLSSVVMGLTGWLLLRGEIWTKSGSAAVKAAYLSGTMIFCVIIYVIVNGLLKNEELQYVRGVIMKKLGKR